MFLLLSVNCSTRVSSFYNQFKLAVRAVTPFRIRRKHVVSLACVSSETPKLQRVFRPGGVVPYIGCIGMCRAKRVFFAVLV